MLVVETLLVHIHQAGLGCSNWKSQFHMLASAHAWSECALGEFARQWSASLRFGQIPSHGALYGIVCFMDASQYWNDLPRFGLPAFTQKLLAYNIKRVLNIIKLDCITLYNFVYFVVKL